MAYDWKVTDRNFVADDTSWASAVGSPDTIATTLNADAKAQDEYLNLFGSRKRKKAAAKAAGLTLKKYRGLLKDSGTNIRKVVRGAKKGITAPVYDPTTGTLYLPDEAGAEEFDEEIDQSDLDEAMGEGGGGRGLSTGAIIGIVGGGLLVVGTVLFLVLRKK